MELADAYLDRIDFLRYLPRTDCGECGCNTCREFVYDLKAGQKKVAHCPGISEHFHYPFKIALDADRLLPKFPCLMAPRPGPVGLIEINAPDADSPILISGNNVHTQDILSTMLGTTGSPFFMLFVDTKGDPIDMAVLFESLTPERIMRGVLDSQVLNRVRHQEIVIPGLARTMSPDLSRTTSWKVTVGPICAAELPLFLATRWLPPM